jgi:hypothetical protein
VTRNDFHRIRASEGYLFFFGTRFTNFLARRLVIHQWQQPLSPFGRTRRKMELEMKSGKRNHSLICDPRFLPKKIVMQSYFLAF